MDRKVDPATLETDVYTAALPSTPVSHFTEEGRFLPGALLGGRYRIIGLLGVGGMGEVYRATDLTLGQSVALKFLPIEAASNQRLLERFHGEVRVARQVSHPNVCRVYDIGEVEGMPFISMEYIDGEDLATLILRIGRLPADKAIEIARKICAGLAAAHDRGVVHRDLKPHNIMLNKRGEVVIMDFGLAAIADQLSGPEVRNGTPAYMSPEQLKGTGATARSDIYALGLVLYELFTGRRPYDAKSVEQLIEQEEAAQLTSMSSIASDIDPAVDRVIRQCLSPEPASRPPSALSVSAALPGGDPLAAALAAGETPSPEMVAASGETEGLARRYAIACLVGIIVLLFASTLIRDRSYAMLRTPLDLSPEVLSDRSRSMAASFGYNRRPMDSSIELKHRGLLIRHLNDAPLPHKWDEWLASEAPIMSEYREALENLVAEPFGRVKGDTPAPIKPGMVYIVMEGRGHLREFYAAPYDSTETVNLDVDRVFQAMGFDRSAFEEVSPHFTPIHASDALRAWKGTHPVIPGLNMVLELGSWKGRVTHVRVAYPFMLPPDDPELKQRSWMIKARGNLILAATAMGMIFVVLLARRNWRLGRTDRRGAFRVATVKFLLGIVVWLGAVHAVQSEAVIFFFLYSAAESLIFAAMVWVLYLALEPAVRSRWPHSIVTWNRVLTGRWMDAQVGAHILIGAVAGGFMWTTASLIEYLHDPQNMVTGGALSITLGTRQWIADHANTLSSALTTALIVFFAIFGFRVLMRKDIFAAIAASILFTAVQSQVFNSPDWQVRAIVYIGIFSILIFILLRLGFVATMAAVFFIDSFDAITLGLDWKTWYSPAGIATLLLLISITLFAFWRSLGSRELLGGSAAQ